MMKLRSIAVTLSIILSLSIALLEGCVPHAPEAQDCCKKGISEPQRTQGLKGPAPQGEHNLVTLQGPGVFLSAQITKQGGTNDLTFIILDIDGKNVVNSSVAGARNWGLTQNNPYGLVLVKSTGDIKTLTFGLAKPLRFESELTLRVNIQEPNVVQIVANVIHGK